MDYNNDYTQYHGSYNVSQTGSFALIALRRGILQRSHFIVAEIRGIASDYHARSPILETRKEAERERDYLMSHDKGFGFY